MAKDLDRLREYPQRPEETKQDRSEWYEENKDIVASQ